MLFTPEQREDISRYYRHTYVKFPMRGDELFYIQSVEAFKITGMGGNLAAELGGPNGAGKVGAVESVLKTIAANATVIAYQVDSNSQLSVITERSSDTAATLQTAIQALGSNIGSVTTVDASSASVSTTGGIKLA